MTLKLPFKVSAREKKFLIVCGLAVVFTILFAGYYRYADFKKSADDFLDARRLVLEKQLNRISARSEVERSADAFKKELEEQEKALLQGDKPPVAAAALQRLLKETAASQGIDITSERTLNPVEDISYTGVPVEIGFATTTGKLRDFMYRLRITPFQLNVSGIKVRVTNISNPTDIYTTIVVTGFIKKPVADAKGKDGKNAA
ncbi:MAG: hypothetical protein C4560_08995 [Nitrospiraceae bacterium]|nr:MAG: hypothetical protein C4560_08995 [Nitrospiraceae bacterium]